VIDGKWDRERLVGWCKVGDGIYRMRGVAVFLGHNEVLVYGEYNKREIGGLF